MVKIGDKQIPWRAGLTVAALIREIDDPHRYVLVRLNGKIVAEPRFESTMVPDQSEIILIPLIAGG